MDSINHVIPMQQSHHQQHHHHYHHHQPHQNNRSTTTQQQQSSMVTTTTTSCQSSAFIQDPEKITLVESPDDIDNNGHLPDVVVGATIYEDDDNDGNDDQLGESYLSVAIQVFIPFLIAGFGMVFAGLVLDQIQHWPVFEEITELVILIPALLGLKGNLEMTLASRLSTQANLGHMDTTKQKISIIVGNLILIQCQAIVIGFMGALVAVVMGGIKSNDVELDHVYLLCASSLVTVSIASFVLGLITAGVIVCSRHCHINPDNVATPIAASLGDITSLTLLSWVSTILYDSIGTQDWLAPVIIVVYILAIPLWVWIAKKNVYTRDVLYNGWTPVMGAMLISSMGGLILDFMVSRFHHIAVFQPVINGVGGNLVAVQASRISTALHKQAELGILKSDYKYHTKNNNDNNDNDDDDDDDSVIFISPIKSFCGWNPHARTTRVLMSMALPGHLIFIFTIDYLKGGDTSLSHLFVIIYSFAALLQVATLLYIAYIMIHWMWKKKIDPDNSAIPYLTSIGDLLGISLLAIAFQFLYFVNKDVYVYNDITTTIDNNNNNNNWFITTIQTIITNDDNDDNNNNNLNDTLKKILLTTISSSTSSSLSSTSSSSSSSSSLSSTTLSRLTTTLATTTFIDEDR